MRHKVCHKVSQSSGLSLMRNVVYRYDTSVSEREELERELNNLRSNVDDCTIGRVDLERKLVSLREELDFENLAHIEVNLDLLSYCLRYV